MNKHLPLFIVSMLFLSLSLVLVSAQESYRVTPEKVTESIRNGDFIEVPVEITNTVNSPLTVTVSLQGGAALTGTVSANSLTVEGNDQSTVTVTLFGQNVTQYFGLIRLSGDVNHEIPINITVRDLDGPAIEALVVEVVPISEEAKISQQFDFRVSLTNLLSDQKYNVTLRYSIDQLGDDPTYTFERSFFEETETVELDTTQNVIKSFEIPDFIRPGWYVINVKAEYLDLESSASRKFKAVELFWDHKILGILPVRWAFFIGFFILVAAIAYFIYWRRKAKKKRYVVKVDYNLLPKLHPRAITLGLIAETKVKAHWDLEAFTTHSLIAGSTGGGKTVSAEVIVEEALEKGVAIIVFDPTAQWSGFLRRNVDKRMFDLYPKFNMKKNDARAYNGNVRQIMNAREIIDIKKYMKPGEIMVFTINKLDPEDADILVANTIREVFHANLPESPELKLMIIFDEVHRLLPKYGGSGQGFIQIERGAREFRKWGVGLMLISQVLKDFVGETKANINTEIQMRTRDQGDLERIKTKYGGYMLQSLLKSATGTGMFENAQYNKGNPYFISLRPLKHMHARLSDDELTQYNKYNDMLDDIEFSIDALEKEKVDVFDLRLEHKMALEKVKSGSFNMVDIYLEGLKPRLETQWQKIGKQPPKRQTRLVSESELMEEFERAKAARKQFAKDRGGDDGTSGGAATGPLTLGGGMYMVTSKTELLDALNAMDDETFGKHVNDSKNEIADWLVGIDKNVGEKTKACKTRADMIKVVEESVPKN